MVSSLPSRNSVTVISSALTRFCRAFRPFSGRLEGGQGLRYLAAATTIDVTPGETVVFAEIPHEVEETTVGLSGGGRARGREQQVLLISVEVENP